MNDAIICIPATKANGKEKRMWGHCGWRKLAWNVVGLGGLGGRLLRVAVDNCVELNFSRRASVMRWCHRVNRRQESAPTLDSYPLT